MPKNDIVTKLEAIAEYLKRTRAPVGEKTLIERILTAAVSLEDLAKELKAEETANEAENQQGE